MKSLKNTSADGKAFSRWLHAAALVAALDMLAPAPAASAQEALQLPLPAQAAGPACGATGSTGNENVGLRRSFFDDFNSFNLESNVWTPHYDGGYDANTKKWLGYDWTVKRTAPGNHEQEIYVDPAYKGSSPSALGLNPFSVESGILHITAERTPSALRKYLYDFEFTSGILTTRKSFVQSYGYFEMRAKVPAGKNLLPAFWLLSWDKSWPPELDVMEAPGHEPDKILSTVHWKDDAGKHMSSGCRTVAPDFGRNFHTYGALWTPERVVYYIDRKPIGQIVTPPGLEKPMYMLVNLAVGGDWVGRANDQNPMPVDFEVDYIAAYTMGNPAACAVVPSGVKICPGK